MPEALGARLERGLTEAIPALVGAYRWRVERIKRYRVAYEHYKGSYATTQGLGI